MVSVTGKCVLSVKGSHFSASVGQIAIGIWKRASDLLSSLEFK